MSILSSVRTELDGKVITKRKIVVKYGKETILEFDIESKRNSGKVDTFTVHFNSNLNVIITEGTYVHIVGDIRTFANSSDYVHASEITKLDEEPETYINDTYIDNAYLKKFIEVRKSFDNTGKDVANYVLRLDRGHGRYSQFRATSWGRDAILIGNVHEDIEYVNIKCRLQSFQSANDDSTLHINLAVNHLDICKEDD